MIEVKGLAAFKKQLNEIKKQNEQRATEIFRGYVMLAYKTLVKYSPQYSGDFVLNWNLDVHGHKGRASKYKEHQIPKTQWKTIKGKKGKSILDPFKMGDNPAVAMAMAKVQGKESSIRLGKAVYIINNSHHKDEAYALPIWNGEFKLRSVNGVKGYVFRKFQQEMSKYSGTMSKYQENKLRKMTWG